MEQGLIEEPTFNEWFRVATGSKIEVTPEAWKWLGQFEQELRVIFTSKERWRQRAIGVAPEELVKLWDSIEDEERKAAAELDELRTSREEIAP